MKSKIAEAIKLKNYPVAVIRTDEKPDEALMFKEGKWGCVVAMINAASKGKTVALSDATVVCQGGHAGCGFGPYEEGFVDKFLADGDGLKVEGERYKASQELALKFMRWQVVPAGQKKFVVMKPLSEVTEADNPEAVIFLVNADRLSGLATLANFDTENQDNVKHYFGAGCGQSIGNVLDASVRGSKECFIGMTDPSARKVLPADVMSFSIPFNRFLEMEENADKSFFHTQTWETICKRLA